MKIGLIGYGAIGQEIARVLCSLGEEDRLAAVLVREGRSAPRAVHDVAALVAKKPDIVLECAGHQAVMQYVPALLSSGINVMISSVGGLADTSTSDLLMDASERGGAQLLIPAGAVAGLDGLAAARFGGLKNVTYTSLKPPHAWLGTRAESMIDLAHTSEEEVFFEGNARDAALQFPKNANVAVAVALAGLGLELTRVRLVSSRAVTDPLGIIYAEGDFGHFRFEIFGRAAPDNPKTSLLTAYSLLQCARLGVGLPVSELLAN